MSQSTELARLMIGDASRQRLREIATQAWRMVQEMHHDPIAEILRAIDRGIAEAVGAEPGLATLMPAQRQVVGALERGPLRVCEIAKAVGKSTSSTWAILQRLVASRVVKRGRMPGTYLMRTDLPATIPIPHESVANAQAVLALCRQHGSVDCAVLVASMRIRPRAAASMLKRMHHRGRLVRIRRGIYAPPIALARAS